MHDPGDLAKGVPFQAALLEAALHVDADTSPAEDRTMSCPSGAPGAEADGGAEPA